MRDGDPAVCLVNMPLSGVERPSIALGLLKSVLVEAGIGTEIAYPNLWFLEFVGLKAYRTLDSFRPEEAVVDWLFGAAAFPDFAPDHDAFLARLAARSRVQGGRQPSTADLLTLRGQMAEFIDWAARKVLARRPRIVGCTSTFQQHVASLALLRRVRELAPEVITLLGGANCESVMGLTTHRNFPWVDYVVSGEADAFVVPFVAAVLAYGRDVPARDLPVGVFAPVHRAQGYPSATVGDGVPRAVTQDIRALPLPDYTDYFRELGRSIYAGRILPGIPMEFSRGCWWGAKSHCTFCGLNGGTMSYRAKPAEGVADAMRTMVDRYGTRRIEAVDNILDPTYLDAVMPQLKGDDLSIFFEVKSNLRRPQLETLAEAGVRWIQPGIESLDSRVLKLMRKGCTAAQNLQLLRWSRQLGVRVSWSVICGFPGEEDEWYAEMAAWLPLIAHLQPGRMIPLRYDRYSPYFTDPGRYGLALRPVDLYAFAYPLDEADLANQVYFFENGASEAWEQTLARRPGLRAAGAAVAAWFASWSRPALPMLAMSEQDGVLVVEDTRPCAMAPLHRLDGLSRVVLKLADEGLPEVQLSARLSAMGCGETLMEEAVSDLVARRLAVRLDGRLIALPLWKPHRPIPAPSAFPGGYVTAGEDVIETLLAAGQ